MKTKTKQSGFSLTEVLMAVGILLIGFMMVAGTFPVGIHLTAVSTERTLGAVTADEAFTKIKLYGIDPTNMDYYFFVDFNDIAQNSIDASEFLYPSDSSANQNFNWSAICRASSDPNLPTFKNEVQATVFVSRKVGTGDIYYDRNPDYSQHATKQTSIPLPVRVQVPVANASKGDKEIRITSAELPYFTDESIVIDDETGYMYQVIEIIENRPNYNLILKNEIRQDINYIWVVPPPVDGGRYPCVGVYQRIINF